MESLPFAGLLCFATCLSPDAELGGAAEDTSSWTDFANPAESGRWRVVNDVVIGGKSEGSLSFGDESMVFSGEIVTDGGGFSSAQRGLAPGALAGREGVRVRMKHDGRGHRLTFRDGTAERGGEVMFRAPLAGGEADADGWREVPVRFDALTATFRGQPVDVAPFDPAEATQVGLILADGKDGGFKIEVAWIRAVE